METFSPSSLEKALKAASMSQRQLSERIQLSSTTVNGYLMGKFSPSEGALRRMEAVLGRSLTVPEEDPETEPRHYSSSGPISDSLRKAILESDLSTHEISELTDLSQSTVCRALRQEPVGASTRSKLRKAFPTQTPKEEVILPNSNLDPFVELLQAMEAIKNHLHMAETFSQAIGYTLHYHFTKQTET